MSVGGRRLDQALEAAPEPRGHRQVGPHERVAAVDRRDDQPATGPQPAAEIAEGGLRVGEVLDGEAREDDVERRGRERRAVRAEVDRGELIEVGQRARRRRMDVGADEACDAGPEGLQLRDTAAAGVEDREPTGLEAGRGVKRRLELALDDLGGRRPDAQPGKDREPAALPGWHYQAVAVDVSAMPCDSSQRSASIAALQPSPAAVTAWR